jgi:hypothetical protein
MKKLALYALVLLIVPTAVFAQDDDWRNRRAPRDRYSTFNRDMFELTPIAGYRYGGTLAAVDTHLFYRDVDVASGANYGLNFGIPVGGGMKIELAIDRQDTHFQTDTGLFGRNDNLGDFHVTYYQAGVQFPLGGSRNVRPYVSVGAGVANLDPDVAGVSPTNRFSASAGIGVKVPVNRNVGFRLEAKGFYTTLEDSNSDRCSFCDYGLNRNLYQGETNLGVYFSF